MRPTRGHVGAGALFAGLGFAYALVVTLILLLTTHFFRDDESPGRVMAWLTVPVITSFISWIGVLGGNKLMRLFIWFAVLACFFFCWIAIFSIGVYYLPVPVLLIIAVLTPWDPEETGDSP